MFDKLQKRIGTIGVHFMFSTVEVCERTHNIIGQIIGPAAAESAGSVPTLIRNTHYMYVPMNRCGHLYTNIPYSKHCQHSIQISCHSQSQSHAGFLLARANF